jgi:hypothetical protein
LGFAVLIESRVGSHYCKLCPYLLLVVRPLVIDDFMWTV